MNKQHPQSEHPKPLAIAQARSPQDLPLFLTVPEAASILRRGTAFVYQAVNEGRLPAIRAGRGGKIMINRDELFRWGSNQETMAPVSRNSPMPTSNTTRIPRAVLQ
ncbi:MAG: helix-turn-helix domain-containing protein [Bacteroidota bacterium]